VKASNKICPDKMSEDFGSLLESGQFRYYRTCLSVIRILILSSAGCESGFTLVSETGR
jgi:hypothetical protein